MKASTILSKAESLQILKNDLRKHAVKKRAAELKDATAERRASILAEIERDVQKEAKLHARKHHFNFLLH